MARHGPGCTAGAFGELMGAGARREQRRHRYPERAVVIADATEPATISHSEQQTQTLTCWLKGRGVIIVFWEVSWLPGVTNE